MSKRCLQRENVHPTANGMGRVGMAQLVGGQRMSQRGMTTCLQQRRAGAAGHC